jgi:hypothetical protein
LIKEKQKGYPNKQCINPSTVFVQIFTVLFNDLNQLVVTELNNISPRHLKMKASARLVRVSCKALIE